MSQRLRFGIFLAPFHKPGINPTLALQSDLELMQMARPLRLRRGVVRRAPFRRHRNLRLAGNHDRHRRRAHPAHQARHRRRQRLVPQSAVGGGAHRAARPSDARAGDARRRPGLAADRRRHDRAAAEPDARAIWKTGLGIITKLLTGDEPVTFKNDRWDLHEARLHLRPYSNPLFDVAVAAVASPTGAKLAGRHGVGMLSVGATTAAGFDALALHWDVLTAEAKAHGKVADRSKWRLVGLCTSPRPRSRPIATWSTASSTGSATSSRSRRSRRWRCSATP